MSEFDDEPEESKNSQIMQYGFYILVMFLLYVFYRDKFEPSNLFWLYLSYFILLVLLGKGIMVGLRHVSPKGIFPPVVTTIIGKPFATVGEWNLYSMGDIYTKVSIRKGGEGFHWCFNNGTVITPIESDNEIGGLNHIGLVDHKEVQLKDLPVQVVEKILAYGRKPPYWFGMSSAQIKDNKADIEELSTEAQTWLTQKGKVKSIKVSYLTQQLEESFRLCNTYKGLYTEMKSKVEEMKTMIRRMNIEEKKSMKQGAADYILGQA